MKDELANARLADYLLWILRRRRRYRVTGASMLPLLQPGDEVLADPRAYRHQVPRVGDIVVARHPYKREVNIIKRVRSVSEDGRFFLQGDNLVESTDSRTFGPLLADQILGQVTSRFA